MDSLQPRHLLSLAHPEIITHFKDLLAQDPSPAHVDQIDSHFRQLIHDQALPSTLYYPWLCLALRHSPNLLLQALRDPVSYGIRIAGIQTTSHIFHGSEWKARGWDVLGGAEGIKTIIVENLSLHEVKRLSKAIARCRHRHADRKTIAGCVEELLNRLSNESSSRSLFLAVARLYSLCSEAFVADLLATFPDTPATAWLLLHIAPLHTGLLREIAVGRVSSSKHVRKSVLNSCKEEMVWSPAPYTSVRHGQLSGALPPGMLFCLDVYDILAEGRVKVNEYESYIRNSLRLAERKHLPFQSILPFFQQLTSVAPKIWKTGILDTPLALELLRCWSVARFGAKDSKSVVMKRFTHPDHPSHPGTQHGGALEATLVELLQQNQDPDVNPQKYWSGFARTIKRALEHVTPTARLAFLELLCRHSDYLCREDGYEFTFDVKKSPPREKERHTLPRWDYIILSLLPGIDGQVVFDRMLAVNASKDFIPVEDGRNDRLSWEQQCRLKAQWEADGTENFPHTRKLFLHMKQVAEKQRDPAARLQCAKAAVRVAIDSTSLDLFHDVVHWIKRFVRDSSVFPDLLVNAILENKSAAAVLACKIPISRRPTTTSELQVFVGKVDEILRILLEVLVLHLREPIRDNDVEWGLYDLFEHVIYGRLDAVKMYRGAGLGTASEMGEILLMSLVPVMVEYERVAIKEEDAHWGHLLMSVEYSNFIRSLTGLAFLDRLAEQYDAMYQKHRIEKGQRVFDLPEGLPRGASTSQLVRSRAFGGCALKNPKTAPCISHKLNQIIYHRIDVVTAPVPEGLEYLSWSDLEDLDYAFDCYLQSYPPKKRNDALISLWRHYSASADQYGGYFQVLENALVRSADSNSLRKAQIEISRPRLPQATYLQQTPGSESKEVMEWNPAPQETKEESKELPISLLCASIWNEIKHGVFKPQDRLYEDLAIPVWGWEPLYKWKKETNVELFKGLSVSRREAMLLSAMLYLHTQTPDTSTDIGSAPFPNADYPRYPAIRLDEDFVSEVSELGPKSAVAIVRAYVNTAPAQILRDLAMGFLDKIDTVSRTASEYQDLFICTVSLLRSVVLSDSPELAVDPILRVIENNPNDSTYHRELKLLDLGRRLRPDAAISYLERFASFVCEALNEQNKKDQNKEDKPKRFVKVTTVKMLAQLIAQADFIPTSTCLDILNRVFHASHQIDMRVEVVKATLAIFDRVSTGPVTEDTFRFFTSLTFAAAGPSEAEPVTEADWASADEKLPNVSSYKDRPLLELFVKDVMSSLPARHRVTYVQNVLLPLVEESTKQHNRWMDAFLGRLGLSRQNADFGPFSLDVVDTILQYWTDYLPSSFLERYHRVWALAYLSNPAHDTITQALAAKDPGYRQTVAGQHWDEYLIQTRKVDPFARLALILTSDVDAQIEDGLTMAKVAEEYVYRAGVIARNPVSFNKDLRKFTVSLDPLMKGLRQLRRRRNILSGAKDREAKFDLLDGSLEGIVRDIISLRKDEAWIKGPERKPVILPSALELEIQLLPSWTGTDFPVASGKDLVREYANSIIDLLRKCVHDPVSLLQFDELEKDVLAGVYQNHAVTVATTLAGSGEGEDNLLETCLRVRLAKGLLQKVTVVERKLSQDVQGMIGKWRGSANEFVRGMGWDLE